jgi:hypothetical protein
MYRTRQGTGLSLFGGRYSSLRRPPAPKKSIFRFWRLVRASAPQTREQSSKLASRACRRERAHDAQIHQSNERGVQGDGERHKGGAPFPTHCLALGRLGPDLPYSPRCMGLERILDMGGATTDKNDQFGIDPVNEAGRTANKHWAKYLW